MCHGLSPEGLYAAPIKVFAFALAIFVSFVPYPILAQQLGPIVIGQKVKLHSEILKKDRILWIYAPDTSHDVNERFPLMVLLDGDSHFVHTTGIVQALSGGGRMPRIIVVGIESMERTHDFTQADSSIPGSGGADMFLRFMGDELLPYVESHYATAPLRILVGHSLAGSLVLNALLTRPQIANAYFIISPNLWLGNDTLVNQLEQFLKKTATLNAFVYETHTPRESARNQVSTARLWNLIDTYHVGKLHWKMRFMSNETHQSIVHRSIYDGLESFFEQWELREDLSIVGMSGLQRHYKELSDRYGYPINSPEGIVNALGYQSLGGGRLDEAIAIFKWNVQHYPNSSNVYDSLGEAYAKKGDTKLAIENYEKSIALDPNNTTAIETLKKLKAK
jgi:predicted alpha/beta superfamily hydrolase